MPTSQPLLPDAYITKIAQHLAQVGTDLVIDEVLPEYDRTAHATHVHLPRSSHGSPPSPGCVPSCAASSPPHMRPPVRGLPLLIAITCFAVACLG